MHAKKLYRLIVFLLFLLLSIFLIAGFSQNPVITKYTYQDSGLPKDFQGYRIVFLSDFHGKSFGKHEKVLIQKIKSCKPDVIVITGDTVDPKHDNLESVQDLLSGIQSLCPIYAISGNHEFDDSELFRKLLKIYQNYGIVFLDNSYIKIRKGSSSIGLYGARYQGLNYTDMIKTHTATHTKFNILLAHDATTFDITSRYGYNLVLSGHTHGGIIRLPFIGGLINNNGSLIATYECGSYVRNGSTMISNRGLGDSILPRFYNRPEIVCITLEQYQN